LLQVVELVKEVLGVPNKIRVVAYTPLGYPDEKKGQVFAGKPLRDIYFYKRYGQAKSQGIQGVMMGANAKIYIKGRKLSEKFRNRLAVYGNRPVTS
jgi:hypothetical protein